MSPPEANLQIEQAGRVAKTLSDCTSAVEVIYWARKFKGNRRGWVEMDRLVVMLQKAHDRAEKAGESPSENTESTSPQRKRRKRK